MPSQSVASANASFEDDWRPEQYLASYYRSVQPDEQATMRFLVRAASMIGSVPMMLEFGCGPTVHHLFPFARSAHMIHVADYLECNLDAVADWMTGAPDCHDWSSFVSFTLRDEGGLEPTADEVDERVRLTRNRIVSRHLADARYVRPLGHANPHRGYPLVLCCFCPDSITDEIDEWRRCMRNIVSLVEPGGWFVFTALRNAAAYRVGDSMFPSAGVTEFDVAEVLRSEGFSRGDLSIEVADVVDEKNHGFSSVIFAIGRRR